MKHPVAIFPDALKALQSFSAVSKQGNVSASILEFARLRASQINGCSLCVDMHCQLLKKAGESDQRIFAISAWRDTPFYSEQERAALALSESVTRLSDRADPVPDDVWQEAAKHFDEEGLAALLIAIATINVWNRLNSATKQMAGSWTV